jgi:hypothetical protein
MFTTQRPVLARQSWKISLGNYFLAVLVGCCFGSLAMVIVDGKSIDSHSVWSWFLGAGLLAGLFLTFSIPFAIIGLVPVAMLGEVLARKSTLHPWIIAFVTLIGSVPVAWWVMPGAKFTEPRLTGVMFGLFVTSAWVILSFRPDGLGSLAAAKNA